MEDYRELEEFPGYLFGYDGTILSPTGEQVVQFMLNGYYRVVVNNKIRSVHRLICRAWHYNVHSKPCVDHINRVRTDNCVDNLRWATHMENSNNRSIHKNNKSGIAGLSFDTRDKLWTVSKNVMGVRYKKHFKVRANAESYLLNLII